MNSLLSHIKQFIPLNDLLNFVFKTALSSYIITDDVDIPSIEKEISSKAFFSLKNIRLNTANINSFLVSSPIQLLNGTIRNVEISGNCSLEVALRLSMYFNRSVNELFFVSDDNPSFCNDKQPLIETETTNG